MSKEWSVCKHEKRRGKKGKPYFVPTFPIPAAFEKYNHKKTDEDYKEWLKNASPYLYKAANNES